MQRRAEPGPRAGGRALRAKRIQPPDPKKWGKFHTLKTRSVENSPLLETRPKCILLSISFISPLKEGKKTRIGTVGTADAMV
jgi:hypothetical protein